MATQLQMRRGTQSEHSSFTGAEGEVSVNTTNDSLHVHDGSTASGFELARVDGSNWSITNAISTTANISFGDNDKAIFGAGSDLQIYHDGSNSIVADVGTGHLKLLGNDLRINNADSSKSYFSATNGGSAILYHDGAAKLATTSTGIDVTGTVTADGLTVDGGSTLDALELTASSSFPATGFSLNANGFLYGMAGSQGFILRSASNSKALLNISENNDISFYEDTGTTPKFFWDASAERLGVGTTNIDGAVTAYGNSDTIPAFSMVSDTNHGMHILHRGTDGDFSFEREDAGTKSEFMRVDRSSGNVSFNESVGIGTSSPANDVQIKTTTNGGGLTLQRDSVTEGDYSQLSFVPSTSDSADPRGWIRGHRGSSSTNTYLTFGTDNTERMRIDSSGRVSVGTKAWITSDANVGYFGGNDTQSNHISFYDSLNLCRIYTNGSERMRIDSSGNLLVGGTTYEGSKTSNASSAYIASTGFISANVTNDFGMQVNRTGTNGTLVNLRKNGVDVGSISVSGSTVSYNPFMGSHYSETADTGMLFGTVMEATGDLVENQYTAQKRLTKTQVSTTSESAAVYGVWISAMEGGGETIAAVGASWCRINSSATVAVGDLLTSNGDGTAKVQSDDIIRSKTIGKVTSTTIKETHADGSYVVPVVLYCG